LEKLPENPWDRQTGGYAGTAGLCKLSSALQEHPSSKNEPINNQRLYMLTQNRANKLIKRSKDEDSILQSAHPKVVSFLSVSHRL